MSISRWVVGRPDHHCGDYLVSSTAVDSDYAYAFTKDGLIIYVDENGLVKASRNDREGPPFKAVDCLAKSDPSYNLSPNWNCVSWQSAKTGDGSYMRSQWGIMQIQPQAGQAFPKRFIEDASFYILPDKYYSGYAAVQPIIYPNSSYFNTIVEDAGGYQLKVALESEASHDRRSYYLIPVV